MYAAASRAVQHLVGPRWRGSLVGVTSAGRTIVVRLIDTCACGGNHVIDLYWIAFRTLSSPRSVQVWRY